MYCPQCGEPHQAGQAFCAKCGHLFDQMRAATGNEPATPVYAGFWERFAAVFADGAIVWLATMPVLIAIGMAGDSGTLTVLFYLASIIMAWLYYAGLESGEKSATFGKRWLGLKVVTEVGQQRIGFGRASGRYLGRILSLLTIYVGYLIQPFTKKRQTLHDMLSGTVVIRVGEAKRRGVAIAIAVFFLLVALAGIVAAISIPAYQTYADRARVAEAMNLANHASRAVGDHYKRTGAIPASLAEAGFTGTLPAFVASAVVNPGNGIVVLSVNPARYKDAALIMIPAESGSGEITWACRYVGLPERVMAHWQDCRPYQPQ